jgi:hypothetical protein
MISDRVLAVERMAQRSSLRNSTRGLWDQYKSFKWSLTLKQDLQIISMNH